MSESIWQRAGRSVYLTRQSWSDSEGEAVESGRGGWARWQRSTSIHLIDIREPEVLLHRQPEHRDKEAEDGESRHFKKVMQGCTKQTQLTHCVTLQFLQFCCFCIIIDGAILLKNASVWDMTSVREERTGLKPVKLRTFAQLPYFQYFHVLLLLILLHYILKANVLFTPLHIFGNLINLLLCRFLCGIKSQNSPCYLLC